MHESEIMAALDRIEAQLNARGTPEDVTQALKDILAIYGEVGQTREVLQRLVELIRAHDQASKDDRQEVRDVLIQVREVLRQLVRSQQDLARAWGGGDGAMWRVGEGDRRRE